MRKFLSELLFVILFMAVLGMALDWMLGRPIVYRSWTTKECVKVDDPFDRYSCEDQPSSALTVWVR